MRPHLFAPRPLTSLLLALFCCACSPDAGPTDKGFDDQEEKPTQSTLPDEASELQAEYHPTSIMYLGEGFETFGEEHVVEPSIELESFVGLRLTFHADSDLQIELQTQDAQSAQWSDWRRLDPNDEAITLQHEPAGESPEDGVQVDMELGLERPASKLRLRGNGAILRFARLELFPDTVSMEHNHEGPMIETPTAGQDDHDLRTLQSGLARAGRWYPNRSAKSEGEKQYVPYVGAPSRCAGGALRGTRQLANFLVKKFKGARSWGGYACRPNTANRSKLSVHASGRAIDLFIPLHRGQADNDLGDPVANYLAANARKLGVQFFIWDRAKWNASYRGRKDAAYGGPHPHHDHLHIELHPTWASRSYSSFPAVSGSSTPPKPRPFTKPFADDDGNPHEGAIKAIYEAGITAGCAGGARPKFCPNDSLTRDQGASFMVRALKLPKTPNDSFDDDRGNIHESAINRLAATGITRGCGASNARTFCPDRPLLRGQLAIWLVRGFNLPATDLDLFSDDDGRYYEDAVNRLAAAGITAGCGGDKFCGDKPINRAQTATLLARALGLNTRLFTPPFADDDGSPFEPAIVRLYNAGIIKGCGENRVCPKSAVTRAQLATFFDRAFDLPSTNRDYFDDDDGSIHESAINNLAEARITRGCGSSNARTFCPGDSLRRWQLIVMLDRVLSPPRTDRDYFGDDDGSVYEAAANRLAAARLLSGCADRRVCGEDEATRGQLAALLDRALGL